MKSISTNLKGAMLVLWLAFSLSSCMSMRVVGEYDSAIPSPERVTRYSFLWGLVQPNDVQASPYCDSFSQVTIKNNVGHILLAGLTLGIVVPMTLEYECEAYEPIVEDL